MQARLFCKTGELRGAAFQIGPEATIGKNPGNSIQLSPTTISGNHARIFFDSQSNSYFIEDLKSRNGTKVNGMTVNGKEKLGSLQVITFARQFDFIFQQVNTDAAKPVSQHVSPDQNAASPSSGEKQKTVIGEDFAPTPQFGSGKETPPPQDAKRKTVIGEDFAPVPEFDSGKGAPKTPDTKQKTVIGEDFAPVPQFDSGKKDPQPPDAKQKTVIGDEFAPVPRFDKANIGKPEPSTETKGVAPVSKSPVFQFVVELKGENKIFNLKEGENNIGRSANNDIMIDDPSMSRTHSLVIVKGEVVTIKDLGSKNHTFVDNQRVSYEVELRSGNTVSFGLVKAIFQRK